MRFRTEREIFRAIQPILRELSIAQRTRTRANPHSLTECFRLIYSYNTILISFTLLFAFHDDDLTMMLPAAMFPCSRFFYPMDLRYADWLESP
jgi:hypothetical protein